MSRRYRQYKNFPENSIQSRIASIFELAVYMALCFQIASTAIYYNGIMHPLVHKMLLGQVMALAAWFFYLLHSIAAGQFVIRNSPYYVPILALAAWAGIRSYTAPNTDAVQYYWIFINFICVFPLWVTCFRSRFFRSMFVWTVVFCGAVMTIGCIRQLMTADPQFHWSFFPAIALSPGTYDRQRLGSFMGHNNDSTDYIAIAVLFAGALWVRYRKNVWSVLFGLFILIGLIFIVLGGSRGVTLMLAAASLVLLAGWKMRATGMSFKLTVPQVLIDRRKQLFGLGTVMALIFLAVIGYGVYKTSVASIKEKQIQSVWSRFLTPPEHMVSGTYPRCWLMSLLMARDNPLAGVGFNAWSYRYPDYQKAWFTQHTDTRIGLPILGTHSLQAHNDYLQLWAELGGIGLLILLWLLWTHARIVMNICRTPSIPSLVLFTAAITVATLTRAMVAFPFHMAAASCLFIANVGLISSQICDREWIWRPKWLPSNNNPSKGAAALVVLVFFLALGYPLCVMIVADYSSEFHYLKGIAAGDALKNNDIAAYRAALDDGYNAMQYSLQLIPNQGQFLNEIGAETVNRGIEKSDPTVLLKAIDYLKRAQESYGFYQTHEHLGKTYRNLWELTKKAEYLEEAIKEYREAVAIMPTSGKSWIQLGFLLAKSGQIKECIDLLANTELRFPDFIERELLTTAKTEQKLEDRVALYDLAVSIKPGSETVLRDIVLFYLELKRMDRASAVFTHMAQYQSKETVVNYLTMLLKTQLENGMIQEALDMTRKLKQQSELQFIQDLWYYSGIVNWIGGNFWATAADWGMAKKTGVAWDQLEPVLPIVLYHIWAPLNDR